MKIGDEILVRAKVVGFAPTPADVPQEICSVRALARIEIGDVSTPELVKTEPAIRVWIDAARCVLIPEKI